jgi:Kdo2-lipid IVA lauroyltransferase/acyltransferase
MKDFISYYLLLIGSRIASVIPFRILYLCSDITYFILYYFIRYRRETVVVNLAKSFPEKMGNELKFIEKNFYKYFCDSFFENLTLPYIGKRRLNARFSYKNPEIFEPYFQKNKSIILVAAHYGNWEMSLNMQMFLKHRIFAAYKSQSNKGFDKFFIKTRSRMQLEPVLMNNIAKRLVKNIQNGIPTIAYMLGDQTPDMFNVRYWTIFLNQDTPVLLGPEKLARKLDLPVFFLDIIKKARGKYEASFQLIEDNPAQTKEFEIVEKCTQYLEKMIIRDPTIWLWSHNRWKHRRFQDFLKFMGRTIDSPGVSYNPDILKGIKK